MTATRHIATSSADGRRARKLTCILSACKSPIPDVPVPLLEEDADAVVPLGSLVDDMYEQDYYSNYADYDSDPEGPLSDDDRQWIDLLLREKGLRT